MLPFRSVNDQKPLEASKWLKIQLLVDAEEMQELFNTLGNFLIFETSGVRKRGEGLVSHADFLKGYTDYVQHLKKGEIPLESNYRTLFSSVFTTFPDALYAIAVAENQQLIRVSQPVVQLQAHKMHYSGVDGKFHTMVFGTDSITWGLQISYPQLYRDPVTCKVDPVHDTPQFPNTHLFKQIQKWVRQATIPTPFIVGEEKLNIPVRLGKKCLPWINQHPQLQKKGLRI